MEKRSVPTGECAAYLSTLGPRPGTSSRLATRLHPLRHFHFPPLSAIAPALIGASVASSNKHERCAAPSALCRAEGPSS
eukprot:scaffold81982_cov31-Tisochrysis_lutea.AAC.2